MILLRVNFFVLCQISCVQFTSNPFIFLISEKKGHNTESEDIWKPQILHPPNSNFPIRTVRLDFHYLYIISEEILISFFQTKYFIIRLHPVENNSAHGKLTKMVRSTDAINL